MGKGLKAQTDIAKKQYQNVHDFYEFNKIIKKEKPTPVKYSKSDLIHDSYNSFYKCYRDEENLIAFL